MGYRCTEFCKFDVCVCVLHSFMSGIPMKEPASDSLTWGLLYPRTYPFSDLPRCLGQKVDPGVGDVQVGGELLTSC